jgi:hypothetical protein
MVEDESRPAHISPAADEPREAARRMVEGETATLDCRPPANCVRPPGTWSRVKAATLDYRPPANCVRPFGAWSGLDRAWRGR